MGVASQFTRQVWLRHTRHHGHHGQGDKRTHQQMSLLWVSRAEHGRITALMASFSSQLEERGRHINAYSRHRERLRRESLREVEYLGRQLEDVSADLGRLLDSMNTDRWQIHELYKGTSHRLQPSRYQPGYLHDSVDLLALGPMVGHQIMETPTKTSAGPLGPLEAQGATAPGHIPNHRK